MLKLFMAGGLATAAGTTAARAASFEADELAPESLSLALPSGLLTNLTAGLPSVNLNAAALPLLPQLDAPVLTPEAAAEEAPRPMSGPRMIAEIFGEQTMRQAADDRQRLEKNGKKVLALAGKIASHWGGIGVSFSAPRPSAPEPRIRRHKARSSSSEEVLAAQAAR